MFTVNCLKKVVEGADCHRPVMDIILQRGLADLEMNEHSLHMLNTICMLVNKHSQMPIGKKLECEYGGSFPVGTNRVLVGGESGGTQTNC